MIDSGLGIIIGIYIGGGIPPKEFEQNMISQAGDDIISQNGINIITQ